MVSQTPEGKVLFQFYRPGARQLAIAGDFNGWKPSFHMTCDADGWWRSRIELAPGTYRFRYLADGQWFTDYAAFGVEPGPFGFNSVLKVDAVTTAVMPVPVEPVTTAPKPQPVATPPKPSPRPAPAAPLVRFVPASATQSAEPDRRVRRRPAMAS